MRDGQRFIVAFFVVTYLIPLLGNVMFKDQVLSTFVLYPLSVHALLVLGAVFGLFLLFSVYNVSLFPSIAWPGLRAGVAVVARAYARARLGVAGLGIGVGLAISLSGLSTYRYSAEGISEIAVPAPIRAMLFFAIILNVVITADLFYRMFVRPLDAPFGRAADYWRAALPAVALVCLADGIFTLLTALFALAFSLAPGPFHRVLFTPRSPGRGFFLRRALMLVVLFGVFMAAWYFGSVLKLSSSTDAATVLAETDRSFVLGLVGDGPFVTTALLYLLERFSVFYHSVIFTLAADPETLRGGTGSVLELPLRTLLFRLDYLVGAPFDVVKPELGSIARLNYELLTAGPIRIREGSAPGVLGSFNYVFPFPLNIALCALFLRWLADVIDVFVSRHRGQRLSIFGTVLMLVYLQTVLHSPFDALALFDSTVIYMALLFGIYIAHKPVRAAWQSALVAAPARA